MKKQKDRFFELIEKTNSFFKTDMVYLVHGGFWLSVGQVINTASAFLLALAFSHLVSKDSYGTYKYILSLAGIIGSLSLSGMKTALTQSVSKGFDGSLRYSFWLQIKWSLPASLLSFVGAAYYFFNQNKTLAFGLIAIGIFTPIINGATSYSSFLNGKKLFKFGTIYGIVRSLIPVITLLITILFTENVTFLVFVYFFSITVSLIIGYFWTLKHSANEAVDPELATFSKHLSAISIVKTIANRIDSVFIFHYLGPVELATYSFAAAIPEQVMTILGNIYTLALPKFAEAEDLIALKKSIYQKMKTATLYLLPISLLYALLCPFVYKWFFPQYISSIYYSQIFAVIILIATVSQILGAFQDSQKTLSDKYLSSSIAAVVRIGFTWLFVIFYGIIGVILAEILARLTYFFVSLWLLKKIK